MSEDKIHSVHYRGNVAAWSWRANSNRYQLATLSHPIQSVSVKDGELVVLINPPDEHCQGRVQQLSLTEEILLKALYLMHSQREGTEWRNVLHATEPVRYEPDGIQE
jgi:hypothetical protein